MGCNCHFRPIPPAFLVLRAAGRETEAAPLDKRGFYQCGRGGRFSIEDACPSILPRKCVAENPHDLRKHRLLWPAITLP